MSSARRLIHACGYIAVTDALHLRLSRRGKAVALLREAELVMAMELRDFSDRKERTPGALAQVRILVGRILGARKLCESATMTPGIAAGAFFFF